MDFISAVMYMVGIQSYREGLGNNFFIESGRQSKVSWYYSKCVVEHCFSDVDRLRDFIRMVYVERRLSGERTQGRGVSISLISKIITLSFNARLLVCLRRLIMIDILCRSRPWLLESIWMINVEGPTNISLSDYCALQFSFLTLGIYVSHNRKIQDFKCRVTAITLEIL